MCDACGPAESALRQESQLPYRECLVCQYQPRTLELKILSNRTNWIRLDINVSRFTRYFEAKCESTLSSSPVHEVLTLLASLTTNVNTMIDSLAVMAPTTRA